MTKQGTYHDYDSLSKQHTPRMKCVVCEQELVTRWTDFHGEAVCITCEAPYQLLHYEKDTNGDNRRIEKPPELNVKPELVPFLKQYYQTTKKRSGLGTYLGYPQDVAERVEAFGDWLKSQPNTEAFFK